MNDASAPLILIVEDDLDLLELHSAVLQRHGYAVITARDGAEAFAQLAANRDVRLIVADLHLPIFSALEMYARIKSVLVAPPILICSGWIDPAVEGELADAGIPHLAKPFNISQLLEEVALLIGSEGWAGSDPEAGERTPRQPEDS